VADRRHAVPADHRRTVLVYARGAVRPFQYGISVVDVFEVAQCRFGRGGLAIGAEVPLQIADPKHQLGHVRRPWVQLDPQKLVWVYGDKAGLDLAQFGHERGHLPSSRFIIASAT
jgi:hypothetical protein